ncbi:hypothetical protein O181_110943 [Austropuccinia psidii MF-1]|uniref:Uncharacterized protein n=1 Tax=Austropuccinia psidii MF-1 TaxID=1389203 RepID=A0A9Q3JYP5_9BASI|nr:hypothetical protein [Austropuccinia psidii MF-1]
MPQKMVNTKICKKCRGELKDSLRSRYTEPCSTQEYINALEEIETRTKSGKTWKKSDIKSPHKASIKKDKLKEHSKPKNTNEKRKFHKCGGIGNLANNCLRKAKIIEIVETEGHNYK